MKRPNLTDESAGERVWMPKYPTKLMAQSVYAEARKHYPVIEAQAITRKVMDLYPTLVRAEGESAFFVGSGE